MPLHPECPQKGAVAVHEALHCTASTEQCRLQTGTQHETCKCTVLGSHSVEPAQKDVRSFLVTDSTLQCDDCAASLQAWVPFRGGSVGRSSQSFPQNNATCSCRGHTGAALTQNEQYSTCDEEFCFIYKGGGGMSCAYLLPTPPRRVALSRPSSFCLFFPQLPQAMGWRRGAGVWCVGIKPQG